MSNRVSTRTLANRRRVAGAVLLPVAVLVALVGLAYRGALDVPFHFDDRPNITQNEAVRVDKLGPDSLYRAATESLLKRRPLAYVTFAIDWWRGGGDAQAFHATNIGLHGINAGLVCVLLLLVIGGVGGRVDGRVVASATLGAAFWAVHPIQTQAVTLVVQRMTELAMLGVVLATILYLLARRSGGRRAVMLAVGAALALLVGALSKENAWIGPVLLVLAELAVVRRDRPLFPSPTWRSVALVVVLAAAAAFCVSAAGIGPLADHFAAGSEIRDFTMKERGLTQPRILVFHGSQLLWPTPERFSLEHDVEVSRSLLEPWTTLPAFLVVAAWCAGGLLLLRRSGTRRTAAFFMLWTPVTLLIESSLVPLELIFEHRMYLPTIGLAGLVAMGLDAALRRLRARAVPILLTSVVVVVLLASATRHYVEVWRTPLSLAENSLRHAPSSARAFQDLGQAYLREGRVEEAERALRRSLELNPDEVYSLEYLAVIHLDRGELAEAERLLLRALEVGSASASLRNHLGEVKLAAGESVAAEAWFRAAEQQAPWVPAYRWNRALALERLGRCEEALAEWRDYVRLERDDEASRRQVVEYLETGFDPQGDDCSATPGSGSSE